MKESQANYEVMEMLNSIYKKTMKTTIITTIVMFSLVALFGLLEKDYELLRLLIIIGIGMLIALIFDLMLFHIIKRQIKKTAPSIKSFFRELLKDIRLGFMTQLLALLTLLITIKSSGGNIIDMISLITGITIIYIYVIALIKRIRDI